jgi:hypothetical protein
MLSADKTRHDCLPASITFEQGDLAGALWQHHCPSEIERAILARHEAIRLQIARETDAMASMIIHRLYTDDAGESRFGRYDVDMELYDHAPPAAPFLLSEAVPSSDYIMFRLPAAWVGDQHTTPDCRLVICLTGAIKFVGSTGETLVLHPGDRMMDMNTTGKGLTTEVMSVKDAEGIIIRIGTL